MIHCRKLETIPIRDKSCPNVEEINMKLVPNIKVGKTDKDNYLISKI